MNWIRKILLRSFKKRALLEVRTDMKFIREFRADLLSYDVEKGRSILRVEKAKGLKEDAKLVKETSLNIALRDSAVRELEELEKMEQDLIKYIQIV